MDFKAKWHGAPVYAWMVGGTAVGLTALVMVRRYRAARAAVSGGDTSTTAPTGVGSSSAPLPGSAGLFSSLGALAGSSPTGPLIGYDDNGNPIYGLPKGPDNLSDFLPSMQPADMRPGRFSINPAGDKTRDVAPPATTVAAGNPANKFNVGQLVNPATGEKIVSSVFSPVYGWINETNIGGVYQGGGGQNKNVADTNYGGSYLGYVGSLAPNIQPIERAAHGTFGEGGLSLLPGGGYSLTNSRGEHYNFGS